MTKLVTWSNRDEDWKSVNSLFQRRFRCSRRPGILSSLFIPCFDFVFLYTRSLRKHQFLLALRSCGRFVPRNVCDSAAEIPYWWRNQCLHNKSGSHGVSNINWSNFMYPLVDFGKVLCSYAKELQQNSNTSSREDYNPHILTVLSEILHIYIWPLWPFVFCLLSVKTVSRKQ